ncbi:class F sortase [Luteipulveratus flavus]|uniref:Class F sortase n=1 Tax=Luteipulveratus flavus TaxID=3031728 RepID=A0ABT6C718_9MICO|nr:class F sortase [Luteipulveratus sp. YIM 133296]MDF8264719.1 class F sortase [Luteipulveratus sp. YIM 133296]
MAPQRSLATVGAALAVAACLAGCGRSAESRSSLPSQAPTSSSSVGTSSSPSPGSSSPAQNPTSTAPTPSPASTGSAPVGGATSSGSTSSGSTSASGSTSGGAGSTSGSAGGTGGSGAATAGQPGAAGEGRRIDPLRTTPSGRPTEVRVLSSSGRTLLRHAIGPVYLNARGELNPAGGQAGWYAQAGYVRPGHPGTSVLVGHITDAGRPDTFYNLPDARAGDRVLIRYSSGQEVAFRVTRSAGEDKRAAQYDGSIWGKTSGPSLRLITCDLSTPVRGGHRTGNWVVWATPA